MSLKSKNVNIAERVNVLSSYNIVTVLASSIRTFHRLRTERSVPPWKQAQVL